MAEATARVAMVRIVATARLMARDLPVRRRDMQAAGQEKDTTGVTRRPELVTPGRCSRLTTTCSRRSIRHSSTAVLGMVPASTAAGQAHPMARPQQAYRAPAAASFQRNDFAQRSSPEAFGGNSFAGSSMKAPHEGGGFHPFGGGHSEKSFGGGGKSFGGGGKSFGGGHSGGGGHHFFGKHH